MTYQEDAVNKAMDEIAKLVDWPQMGHHVKREDLLPILNRLYVARMSRTEDDEHDDYDLINVDIAEPFFGAQMGKGLLRTHGPAACRGPLGENGRPICCIHNPSDHHMVTWEQNWRGDKGMMERICPGKGHGIGHPDPDDLAVRTTEWAGVHGCDGCCRPAPKAESTRSEG